jgi:hypothetical protein
VSDAEKAESTDDLDGAKAAADEIMAAVETEGATFKEELAAAQSPPESDADAKPSAQQITEVTDAIKSQIRKTATAKTRAEGDAEQAKMALIKMNLPADAVEAVRDARVAALDAHLDALQGLVKDAEKAGTADDLDAAKAAGDEIMVSVEAEVATYKEDLAAAQAPPDAS